MTLALGHHLFTFLQFRDALAFGPIMVNAAPSPNTTFAHLLVSTPPRERSGSRSSNRFTFQQSWALRLTLELHEKPSDYCVLFDVHDDVVALDHSTVPTNAKFYQVKTKTKGNWTAHQLTVLGANKKGKSLPSILGKLYDDYLRFPGHVERMTFVSNAAFNVLTADLPAGKDRDSICVTDLDATEFQRISDKLTSEHGLAGALGGLPVMYLERTSLSVTDHETHVEGIVCTFLSKQGDGMIPPHAFHKTVRAEIQRRNNKECAPTTFAELLKHKGLTRAQLQAMIDSIPSQKKQDDLLTSIRDQLTAENLDFRHRHSLVIGIRTYLAQRQDPTNLLLTNAVKRATAEIATLPQFLFSSATPLSHAISRLAAVSAKEWQPLRDRYSEHFLHAMFAVLIYEQQFPPPGPQP